MALEPPGQAEAPLLRPSLRRSSELRKIDLDRVAHRGHRRAGALTRLPAALAQGVPDDGGIAVDLLAACADRPQSLDDDLRDQLLVVDAADLSGAAFMVDARHRGLV